MQSQTLNEEQEKAKPIQSKKPLSSVPVHPLQALIDAGIRFDNFGIPSPEESEVALQKHESFDDQGV